MTFHGKAGPRMMEIRHVSMGGWLKLLGVCPLGDVAVTVVYFYPDDLGFPCCISPKFF